MVFLPSIRVNDPSPWEQPRTANDAAPGAVRCRTGAGEEFWVDPTHPDPAYRVLAAMYAINPLVLISLTYDPVARVRAAAYGNQDIPAIELRRALSDASPDVRLALIEHVWNPDALPVLNELVHDPVFGVTRSALTLIQYQLNRAFAGNRYVLEPPYPYEQIECIEQLYEDILTAIREPWGDTPIPADAAQYLSGFIPGWLKTAHTADIAENFINATCLGDLNTFLRHGVARSTADSGALDVLSRDPDVVVRSNVIVNPHIPAHTRFAMCFDAHPEVADLAIDSITDWNDLTHVHALSVYDRTQGIIREIITEPTVRSKYSNVDIPAVADLLAYDDRQPRNRAAAASHVTAPHLITRMITDQYGLVRAAAATNPYLTPDQCRTLHADPDPRVAAAILSNPNAPDDIIAAAFDNMDPTDYPRVRKYVAQPRIPLTDRAVTAAASRSQAVKRAFTATLTTEQAIELATHPDPKVQRLVSRAIIAATI